MGDSGWWVILAFYAFVDPVVIVAGVLVALLARRWSHVLLILIVAPGVYWAIYTIFFRVSHFWDLALPLAVGGLIWGASLYGVKKTMLA